MANLHSISRLFPYLGQKGEESKNAKMANHHSISRIFAYLGPNNNSIGLSNIGE
jgi:hypothetical protein